IQPEGFPLGLMSRRGVDSFRIRRSVPGPCDLVVAEYSPKVALAHPFPRNERIAPQGAKDRDAYRRRSTRRSPVKAKHVGNDQRIGRYDQACGFRKSHPPQVIRADSQQTLSVLVVVTVGGRETVLTQPGRP